MMNLPRDLVEVVVIDYFSGQDRQYVHVSIENCDRHFLLIYPSLFPFI